MKDNSQITPDKSHGNGFLGGVAVLSISTLICKVIGLFFKIPMLKIVGIEGMAYFSSAYNIYMLLNSISAAGLPVAVSLMISKSRVEGNRSNVKRIFRVAITLFLVLGIIGTALLYLGADKYSELIGIPLTAASVRAIAPTLIFICISGAIRGYFQGHEIMAPTAISQLIESIGKLGLGVGFATLALNFGCNASQTAAYAIAGLSAGVLIAMLYLLIRLALFPRTQVFKFLPNKKCEAEPSKAILSSLVSIALPITLASSVTSLTSLADTALITNRLVGGGLTSDAAVNLYSSYTNLSVPLFNLPPALVTPIAVSLIPAITAAITVKDETREKRLFSTSFRLCLALALPAAAGMSVFALPILNVIYPDEVEASAIAAPLLSVLAIAVLFCCLTTVTNAVLQAYGKPSVPIISLCAGAVVKIIAEYILVGTDLGIFGAPISTILCTLTVILLNIHFVYKYTPQRLEVTPILKIFAATIISVIGSILVYYIAGKADMNSVLRLFAAIITAILMYAVFVLLFGVIKNEDISLLPYGDHISRILKKIRLIKD